MYGSVLREVEGRKKEEWDMHKVPGSDLKHQVPQSCFVAHSRSKRRVLAEFCRCWEPPRKSTDIKCILERAEVVEAKNGEQSQSSHINGRGALQVPLCEDVSSCSFQSCCAERDAKRMGAPVSSQTMEQGHMLSFFQLANFASGSAGLGVYDKPEVTGAMVTQADNEGTARQKARNFGRLKF